MSTIRNPMSEKLVRKAVSKLSRRKLPEDGFLPSDLDVAASGYLTPYERVLVLREMGLRATSRGRGTRYVKSKKGGRK